LRQGIINPHNPLYRAWRGLLIGAAAFTGIFIPWELAFGNFTHMYCLDNVATWVDVLLVGLFMADIGEQNRHSLHTAIPFGSGTAPQPPEKRKMSL
jgi:hypothetical protein